MSDRDHGMVRVGSSCGMRVLESDVIQANTFLKEPRLSMIDCLLLLDVFLARLRNC